MKYINSYYNIKIIFAHFFLVDLKRTSEQQQSKQIVVGRNVKLRNFCVSLGELQPRMVSFYRKLDSNNMFSFLTTLKTHFLPKVYNN